MLKKTLQLMKSKGKGFGVCTLVIAVLFSCMLPVRALSLDELPQDDQFTLVDFASGTVDIGSYSTYRAASQAYTREKDNYDNIAIVSQGVVLKAEYAIAAIASTDACDVNVEFTNDRNGASNYTNGCFGKDALYLDTSSDGSKVEFFISGIAGWASKEDIEIVPIQNLTTGTSIYTVKNGLLYHQVKGNLEDENYISIINLGPAPDFLEEGQEYVSYDGHYFYSPDALWVIIDDIRNDIHEGSLNVNNPYYNYYQFVSHRTLTNVTYEQMETYLEDTLQIQNPIDFYKDDDKDSTDDTYTRSQLYQKAQVFWQYQYQYGANALMMVALAANESAYGRSSLAYTRNNLFGHAAYDSDVEKNASRYLRVENSVYSHAKYYISGSYCSPLKTQYHGGYFGNKSSGMNVSYASDPFWGEKAAQNYYKLDKEFGLVDQNSQMIGIAADPVAIEVRQYPQTDSPVLYLSSDTGDTAFVILDRFTNESGDWYTIQSDATLDENSNVALTYDYNYQNDVGYIPQSVITTLVGGNASSQTEYVTVTFDANGGLLPGEEAQVSYAMPVGSSAAGGTPLKDHALFTGWDQPLENIQSDTTFVAQYQDVDSIEMKDIPKQSYEVNDRIVCKGGTIVVSFADGSQEVVPLDSSMVSGFDFTIEGDQEVLVTYGGCTTSYPITVSQELDTLRTELKQQMLDQSQSYSVDSLTQEQIDTILDTKAQMDANMQPYLTQAQFRAYDELVRTAIGDRIRYIIKKNSYNLEVSGLSLSIPLGDSLTKNQFLEDTYRVSISSGISGKAQKEMETIASSMEDTVIDSFHISITKNYKDYEMDRPLVYTMDKPESDDTVVYLVLYYDASDGDVQKCYTRQSQNRISFMNEGAGDYLLVASQTANQYLDEDPTETMSVARNSFDMQQAFAWTALGLIALIVLMIVWHIRRKKKKEIEVSLKRKETSND